MLYLTDIAMYEYSVSIIQLTRLNENSDRLRPIKTPNKHLSTAQTVRSVTIFLVTGYTVNIILITLH